MLSSTRSTAPEADRSVSREASQTTELAAAFRAGMRRYPSGVCLVTTELDGTPYGLVATSVSSVSLEPATLLACVNRSTSCHAPLLASGAFAVNVLGAGQSGLASLFASPANRSMRFSGDGWLPGKTGAPVLKDALASFACRVVETLEVGTHTIVVGEVHAVALSGDGAEALAYLDGEFRQLSTH